MVEEEENAAGNGDEETVEVETSLEELLQRKERRAGTSPDEEDDEEALIEAMDERESRTESLTVKVIPPQPTEFTCRSCFLLKNRSQLKDSKRMLCNDCA